MATRASPSAMRVARMRSTVLTMKLRICSKKGQIARVMIWRLRESLPRRPARLPSVCCAVERVSASIIFPGRAIARSVNSAGGLDRTFLFRETVQMVQKTAEIFVRKSRRFKEQLRLEAPHLWNRCN